MKKYRLSVCKGPDCKRNGADAVFAAAREAVGKAGLTPRCEVYRGGCYGLCHLGPNVVVREDTGKKRDPFSREDFQLMGFEGEAYYGAMNPPAMERVVAEHIGADRTVTELLGDPSKEDDLRKGENK
ncbi:MAG: (2Fe-2S) ferredoxin domain-containing protein [Myxococcota bacterium]